MSEAKFKVGDTVKLTKKGKRTVNRGYYHSKLFQIINIDEDVYVCDCGDGRGTPIYVIQDDIELASCMYPENKQIKSEGLMSKEQMFEQLTKQMLETFKKKNADYGDSTTQTFKEFGLTSYAIRLNDKLNRIKSFCKKGELEEKDESCIDSLLDMANYCLLAVIDIKEKEDGKED